MIILSKFYKTVSFKINLRDYFINLRDYFTDLRDYFHALVSLSCDVVLYVHLGHSPHLVLRHDEHELTVNATNNTVNTANMCFVFIFFITEL